MNRTLHFAWAKVALPIALALFLVLAQAVPARADGGWVPSISGPNGTVYAIVVVPSGGVCGGSGCAGRIYVGGSFTSAGGMSANNVAYYQQGQWYALGSGTNGPVYALGWANNYLYAGGAFSSAGGVSTKFARWNHSAWSSSSGTVNGNINSISTWPGGSTIHMLIGGNFTSPVNGIGVYSVYSDGSTNWTETDLAPASNTQAVSFLPDGSVRFWSYNNGSAYRIQFKSTGGQDSLGRADINGPVYAMASTGGSYAYSVYIGGSFTTVGSTNASYVAVANGAGWNAMPGLDGVVYALAVGYNGELYAGGDFTGRIKRWSGSAWVSLGSGIGGTSVRAIADANGSFSYSNYAGNFAVGGLFTSAGGNSASNFAILDRAAPSTTDIFSGGTSWQNTSSTPSFSWVGSWDYGPQYANGWTDAGYDYYWGTSAACPSVTGSMAAGVFSWSPGAQPSGTSSYFCVRGKDAVGNVSAWSSVVWQYENQPPGTPSGVTGAATWQNASSTPTFGWTAPSDAGGSGVNHYHVYWGTSSSGTSTTDNSGVSYSPGAPASGTSNYFRVAAVDGAGNESAWTTVVLWQYDGIAPTLPGSVTGRTTWQNTSNMPSFAWTASTDTGGSLLAGYDVYWGTDQFGASITAQPSGASYSPGAQASGTSKYFRVRSRDNANNTSAWTTAVVWQYETSAPTLPGSVTGGATWQNSNNTPSFAWTASTDTGGSLLAGYDVYWNTSASCGAVTAQPATSPYAPGAQASGTSKYFCVRARDGAGNLSAWTTAVVWQYDGIAPSDPAGVTGGSTWQHTSGTPSFAWTDSMDTGSGVAGYDVYWGTDQFGTSVTAQPSGASYSPGAQASGTSNYFRVRARDGANNTSAWTTAVVWQYETSAPTLPGSVTGGAAWQNASNYPSFGWTASTDTGSSLLAGYDVYWNTSASCGAVTAQPTYSPYAPGAQASGTSKYFCVRARDGAGNVSAWTAPVVWQYDGIAPSDPADVSGGTTWQNSSNTPSFAWTASTDTGGSLLVGYDVYWGTDQFGTSVTAQPSSASWSPGAQASGTSQYFRVRSRDNAGNTSSWTTAVVWQYETSAPTLPGSATGGTAWQNASATPSFSWLSSSDTGGSGLAGYDVYWNTSASCGAVTAQPATSPYAPGTQASGTSKYFCVRARDGASNVSAWTSPVVWQYDGIIPSQPANITGGTAWQNTSSTPSFAWTASTDTGGSGLTNYDVYWGTDQFGTSVTAQPSGASWSPGVQASGTSQYFRVRSRDNAGNASAWTTAVLWQYDNNLPTLPGNVTGGTAWQNTNNAPSLNWLSSTDTGGSLLAGYDVYWGAGASCGAVTAQPAYSPYAPGTQTSGTSRYFCVRARDGAGNLSAWTAPVVWQYENSAPTLPAGVSGGTAWQNIGNTPSFSWTASTDAGGSSLAGYDVYWGTDPYGSSATDTAVGASYSPGPQASGLVD